MAFYSTRQSAAGDQSGFGIRGNHKSNRAAETDEEITTDSEDDKNDQPGGIERSEPCTNDQATHESEWYKQKTEALKKKKADLGDTSRITSAGNAAMRHEIHSLRAAKDQVVAECSELRKEVANLQKERMSASRTSSWISWNFGSGTRDNETAAEKTIAEARNNIEKCEQKIRELEEDNRKLQQKTSEEVDHIVAQYKKRLGSLEEKRYELQQKMSEQEDHIVKHFEQKIGSLEDKNHKLQQKISEQEGHIQQTLGFVEELEALKSKTSIDAPKLSDTEVQARWRALGFAVRQFVSAQLPESLDRATVQQLVSMNTFSWLPEMKHALRAPIFCSAFLESWVWHFLWRWVFDSQSELWAGQAGSLWATLHDVVQGESDIRDQALVSTSNFI